MTGHCHLIKHVLLCFEPLLLHFVNCFFFFFFLSKLSKCPKVNPPSPVVCPIGGRYSFIQHGNGELEYYRTRIRGVTIRPRTQINCRVTVSEFKSCSQDRSKIEVDEEYCETVDYRGRPIGEYGEKVDQNRIFIFVGKNVHIFILFLI